jgi:choline dehydrogenase-like flavoprotein
MQLRRSTLGKLAARRFDVLVVGGGINGAVAAAALSGKGATVALIDQRDFAGFTSQHSSNLAWGGIKYLESREFGLVRDLCKSRNRLLDAYPSRVLPIRFFSTLDRGFRFPPRLVWAGAWLYWLFGDARTAPPRHACTRAASASGSAVAALAGGCEARGPERPGGEREEKAHHPLLGPLHKRQRHETERKDGDQHRRRERHGPDREPRRRRQDDRST